MPRLIVKQKAEVINELILKGSQVSFKIGSEPDNDLVIDDKKVSMLHAKIERHANTYHLEDLKSAFRTFLNSERSMAKSSLKTATKYRWAPIQLSLTILWNISICRSAVASRKNLRRKVRANRPVRKRAGRARNERRGR